MFARLLWSLLIAFPTPLMKAFFNFGGWMHHRLDRRHVDECVRMVNWSGVEADADEVVRNMYAHLWKMLPELVWLHKQGWDMVKSQISGFGDFENHCAEHAKDGAIIVGAHLGNWELCGQLISKFVSPVMSVYKPFKADWQEELQKKLRSTGGQVPIAKEGAGLALYKRLRRGGYIGMVVDQNGGKDGVSSSFLGRPCSSWDSPVVMSERSGKPIYVVALLRSEKGFKFEWRGPIELVYGADKAFDLQGSVQYLDKVMSDMIELYPDQWLWLGRKWGRDFDREG